ncbi:hypothetical protein ACQ4PT_020240 [Festuca glaucescens]
MEVEAGGPGSKRRRKSAALGGRVRVPSPAEAHDSDPAAKQDDGGADRISDLPDTILASTFRFSATLLAFTLGQSRLSNGITRALHFPLLKHLTLQEVTLSDCSLHSFISGCPALECLLIYGSFGLRSLKINSSTLRSISIKAGDSYGSGDTKAEELVIENAPCLQRLLGLYFGYGLHVSVVSAPKLEAIVCFFTRAFSSTKLVLGSSVMQESHVDSLTMARAPVAASASPPPSSVDAWLRSPALDNLQELEFWFKPHYKPQPLQRPPPPSTFRFSATLRVATIGNCNLPDSIVQGLHLPLLKQLGLELVSISECLLHSLIAGCPALECLLISHGFGFRCLTISYLTLRIVCVKNYRMPNDQLKELIVHNAPCLQSLLHLDFDYGLHVSVVSAPKLETLGCLSDGFYISKQEDLSRFVFGATVI